MGPQAKFLPLDAIPKKQTDELRIIMNLSYPHDESVVNAGVSKDMYLGEEVNLVYPNLDDLVEIIRKKG